MQLRRVVTRTVATVAVLTVAHTAGALAAGTRPRAQAPPPHGLPISRCTTSQGTIVAVDFAPWGGPIVRGCALNQHSGYALLHAAGFATAGDEHDGPGFICRLADETFDRGAGYPTPSQQPCTGTPSASAYWAVWLAPAGADRWHYSQLGAMSDVPRAGEVELWTYGATSVAGTSGSGVPAFAPAQLRSSHRAPTVGAREVRLVDAVPTAARISSGSPVGLIVGGCVALALCAGAGAAVSRRRRDA